MRFSPTILTAVMSYMTHRPDILSVMYASKTVYGAGIPYLLKPCLGFEEERKLSSFCDFILADAPARAKHIRHLRFDFGLDEDDYKFAKKLARVLGQATRLEILEFNWEDSTELNERLVQAFAQLKSVKALIIHEADDAILNMIKQMQSPVEDVYLNAESVVLDDFSVLSSFQSSLRRLSLRAVSSPHHKPGITFPKMHALFVMLGTIWIWKALSVRSPTCASFLCICKTTTTNDWTKKEKNIFVKATRRCRSESDGSI